MQIPHEIAMSDPHLMNNELWFLEGLGLVGHQEKERLQKVKI
jgi:hypothetical protein